MIVVDILVYDGVDEMDAMGPFEVLKVAADLGAPFTVRLVSVEESQTDIKGSHGLLFKTDTCFTPGNQNALIVCGGSWLSRKETGAYAEYRKGTVLEKLKRAHQLGVMLMSVCTGAMLLAHAGVIQKRKMTSHHSVLHELIQLGFNAVHEKVVDDDGLITAGGVTSSLDLGLYLVEKWTSKECRIQVQTFLEYDYKNDVFIS